MESSIFGAVRKTFDMYPMNHEFSLWDLKGNVFRLYPKSKHTHGDTICRRLREARHGDGYEIVCIKRPIGRYKKIKVAKLADHEKKLDSKRKNQ
ncbi:MAG: hypothetical protein FWH12_03795 [Treponema sp.]|nr:hypothetical protein [Treponema sp.]